MSTPHPRDRAVESLLRRHVLPRDGADPACLDAEMLAAWLDGGLEATALKQAEAHVADCTRCQAMMAAIVGSEPAAASPARWWQRFSVRWLVPLTAAAAAAVLWVVAPDRDGVPTTAGEVEQTEARAKFAGRPPAPVPAEPLGRPAEQLSAPAEPLPEAPARRPVAASAAAPVPSSPAATQEASPSAADPAAALATAATPVDTLADAPAPAPTPAFRARTAEADAARPSIVSGDPLVQWRVAGAGIVERSADGGTTWTGLPTGEPTVMTAGSAPTSTVCWLVGPEGMVLLTTDARTWQRVSAPAADDLVAVDATDAAVAVVRTAAGQSFRTVDGGATWVAVP